VWFEDFQFRPWRCSVHLITILHALVCPLLTCVIHLYQIQFCLFCGLTNFYGCFITTSERQIVCRWQLDPRDWCLSVSRWAEMAFVISVFLNPIMCRLRQHFGGFRSWLLQHCLLTDISIPGWMWMRMCWRCRNVLSYDDMSRSCVMFRVLS
jgi:hypothetical protein